MNINTTSPKELDSGDSCSILKTGMKDVRFRNRSETVFCRPELLFAPKTADEIKEVLKLARKERKHVRVVGAGYSTSDLVYTDDYIICLPYFNKVVEVWRDKCLVKVQAGIMISNLNDILYSHDLALSVLGSMSDITVGGAISTATHGTGINYGILSSYVTDIDLMTSDGNIIHCSASENEDIFLAATCGLGFLGIILNVTLKCEPSFQLQMRQYGLSLKDVIENLDIHLTGSDHFRFMWFPYTENVVVTHCTRTSLPPNKDSFIRKMINWILVYGIGYYLREFCYYISTFFPQIVPTISRCYYNLMFSAPTLHVDRSYKIFNYQNVFKQYTNEWAIPKDNTGTALWCLKEWIESNPDVPVHFPVDVRFVKADNLFISPAYGRDTCFINITMYRPYGKDVAFERYWAAFEAIMMEQKGRPHWAFSNASRIKNMYPYYGRWCSIRKQLDPINMFYNCYLSRMLDLFL